MEEFIGGLWHRFITRAASRSHPEAAVRLSEIERTAGILFRALGGDSGLRVAAAAEVEHGARRSWLARIAHAGEKVAHAARDDETLRLPAEIALFPERRLNRDLYLWLAALAAVHQRFAELPDTVRAVAKARLGIGAAPRELRAPVPVTNSAGSPSQVLIAIGDTPAAWADNIPLKIEDATADRVEECAQHL